MKHMNRIFALALALIMVLGLATTAFAAEGDKYEIFQIFTGDISDGKLVNVKWGQNGTGTPNAVVDKTVLDALTAVNNKTDAEKLAVIETYAKLDTTPIATGAGDTYTLANGYYLVRNVAGSQEGEGQFYTLYVVKVVNQTLTIVPKGDAPEVEKTVDKTDVNIGDVVTFTLTATMPSTFEGYESYNVVFKDTLSKGLTYNDDAVVSVNGFTTEKTDPDADGNTIITITNDNVLDNGVQANGTITVTYTATVNANAVIGAEGNPNKVYLEYSNNPNVDGTGKTPEEEVKVYTWDMGVLKYADGDKTKVLEGVKFILLNEAKSKIAKVVDGKLVSWDDYTENMDLTNYKLSTAKDGTIHIYGLASGAYLLRETDALPGYNKLTSDIEATVAGKTDGTTYATYVAEVENQSGATLPSTGGMGTTLFYVIGGLLVAAAVVLLVSKKRMTSAE